VSGNHPVPLLLAMRAWPPLIRLYVISVLEVAGDATIQYGLPPDSARGATGKIDSSKDDGPGDSAGAETTSASIRRRMAEVKEARRAAVSLMYEI